MISRFSSTAMKNSGDVMFGGLFSSPPFATAYAQAAITLYDDAVKRSTMLTSAMPLLYLHRHTLELILKDLLGRLYDIREHDRLLTLLKGEMPRCTSIPKSDFKVLNTSHDLKDLQETVQRNLQMFRFAQLPSEITDSVCRIVEIEDKEPSRFRYEHVFQNNRRMRGFPGRTSLPIKRLYELLHAILDGPYRCTQYDKRGEQESFLESLSDSQVAEFQGVQRAICKLRDDTKKGDLAWRHHEDSVPPFEMIDDLKLQQGEAMTSNTSACTLQIGLAEKDFNQTEKKRLPLCYLAVSANCCVATSGVILDPAMQPEYGLVHAAAEKCCNQGAENNGG